MTRGGVECPAAGDQPQLQSWCRPVHLRSRERRLRHLGDRRHGERDPGRIDRHGITWLQQAQVPERELARLGAVDVPGDLSSAVFFLAAASLLPDSNLVIHNVGLNPTRTVESAILQENCTSVSSAETVGAPEEVVLGKKKMASATNPFEFFS